MNIGELEKIKSISTLINYLADNHMVDYTNMIHVYNDISISVHARRSELNKKQRIFESVSIMKEYLKDTNKQVHIIVNEYFRKNKL